ncbi:MAG: alpha/beta hydrolase [Bacteroidales bacterium]|nr:alpha/beta hydrolase [Bacteroidales bacterium]MBN2762099.1 alpha/beta hydrolase [Bacteroidales bacterium]
MKIMRVILVQVLVVMICVFSQGLADAQTKSAGFCEMPSSWDNIEISTKEIPEGFTKIFIVTNRPYITEPKNHEYFPNDIAEYRKVSYLIATCDGRRWQLNLVSGFEEGMQAINDGRDILLFIEGHGKTLPMALSRAFQVQERYDVAMIIFDWPSKNSNFNNSLARVRRCADNFYNLLLQIRDYRNHAMNTDQNFSILAHSLGNYFLSYLIVCGDGQYLQEPFIDNIVMNAAAIRAKEHGEVLSQLCFQNRLYITSNKNDWVLRGANLLTSGKMLGNFIIPPFAGNADYLDFTDIAGKEHSYYFGYHSFEHSNPAFFYFFNTAIHGEKVNLTDTRYFAPLDGGCGYSIKDVSCP